MIFEMKFLLVSGLTNQVSKRRIGRCYPCRHNVSVGDWSGHLKPVLDSVQSFLEVLANGTAPKSCLFVEGFYFLRHMLH